MVAETCGCTTWCWKKAKPSLRHRLLSLLSPFLLYVVALALVTRKMLLPAITQWSKDTEEEISIRYITVKGKPLAPVALAPVTLAKYPRHPLLAEPPERDRNADRTKRGDIVWVCSLVSFQHLLEFQFYKINCSEPGPKPGWFVVAPLLETVRLFLEGGILTCSECVSATL